MLPRVHSKSIVTQQAVHSQQLHQGEIANEPCGLILEKAGFGKGWCFDVILFGKSPCKLPECNECRY